MQLQDLLIDPSQLASGTAAESWQPLAFVDMDACPVSMERDIDIDRLPPYPVIGFGDPSHALAKKLDAVIEASVSASTLINYVLRSPKAAAVAVQVLRSTDGLPVSRALTVESFCYALLQGSAEHHAWLEARPSSVPNAAGGVVVERQGNILHLTLNRPEARNAINNTLRDQLFEAFSVAALDPAIHQVTLRGNGAAFSIGGDLDEFGTTRDPATAHLIRARTVPVLGLADRRDILDVHVHGACIGSGLELAAFAGRITASAGAWFQLPEVSMGLIPGAGGCVSVPRRIGRQRAGLMILSGKRITAPVALEWGLVDAIVDG